MAGRPIDEKIVVMKLDNSDFQRKAAETTGMFGKLTNALNRIPGINLGKTASELNQISSAAKSANVDGLTNSVNNASSRFTALQVVATTALATVTSMATQAGLSLAKSLTVDQVTDGFREYETKIGAIGTMLANTEWAGSNLDDVKKVLGELNDYADQTIYNFGEMTSSIGRFTAAGVTLEDSAIAIKGLGNLAAVSGSNSEQLNTAMYQMSQALASGKLNLEDWNSLVNAGMAGKKTQDALVATAKAMGKNVDLSEGFRNSIQKGWLTSEVFLETLKKFGADESMTKAATSVRTFTGMMDSLKEGIGSGWATTFEHIFGDFEEATVFWTNLSTAVGDFFGKQADERNKMMEGLAKGGGFQNIFQGIANAAKPVGQIFSAIGDGWRKAFPPKTTDQLLKMTESFKQFTAGLKLSESSVKNLGTIFHGVFSIFSSVWEITKRLGSAFMELIPDGAGAGILGFLANIAQIPIGFNESIKSGNLLTFAIEGLGKVFGVISGGVGAAVKAISTLGSAMAETWGILTKGDFTGVGPWEEDSKIVDWLFKIRDAFKEVGSFIKGMFGNMGGSDFLGAGVLVGIGAVVTTVIKGIMDLFGGFGDAVEGFTDALEGIGDAIQNFAMGIKIANLMLIAISLGLLASSLKTLEGIKTEDISKGIKALAISLAVMMAGLFVITKFNLVGGLRASVTLIALAAAVNTMATALKKISDMNPDEMTRGINGLVGITATLAAALIVISKLGGKVKVGSVQLIALATSIVILSQAVKQLAGIQATSLAKSLGAMGILFAELAIFLKVVNKAKLGVGSALGVMIVAGALQVMVSAIERINGIDHKGLIKGLGTIGILLAEIAIFSKFAGGPNMVMAGVGMGLLSAALIALMIPIATLANMSLTELAKGLGGLAAALTIVGIASKGLMGSAIAGAGLLVMAGALTLLMVPIKAFAAMSWTELAKGFIGLAGGLTVVSVAALLLAPATIPMIAFGAALTLVGIAVLAVGAGLSLFAVGLTTLATLTSASIAAIVAALGLLLQGFATLIPAAVDFVVKLGMALITGLGQLIPHLVTTTINVVLAIMNAFKDNVYQFITVGVDIVVAIANGIADSAGPLVEAGLNLIIKLIQALSQAVRDNGPVLVSTILELLGEIMLLFINAGAQVINALLGWIPGVNSATAWVVENAESVIRDNFGAKEIGESKGVDFAGGLGSKAPDANSAGKSVAESGKGGAGGVNFSPTGQNSGNQFAQGLGGTSGNAQGQGNLIANFGLQGAGGVNFNPTGNNAGMGFAQGLGGTSGNANSMGVSIANSGAQGAGSVSLTSHGSNFGLGFANGMESSRPSIISKAKSLAMDAAQAVAGWLGIHSPSRLLMSYGGFFGEGFEIGVGQSVRGVVSATKNMASKASDSINEFIDGFTLPTADNEIHFKAVVDYDSVDPSRFGKMASVAIQPDVNMTKGLVQATTAQLRQNADNNRIKPYDDTSMKRMLGQISESIDRIDPNKPVLLMLKDKLIGQSVTQEVMDNYDFRTMKAERGLADA